MDFDEILNNPIFFILTGIGAGAFSIMLIILSKMDQASIMPWWVKVIVYLLCPVIAAFFTGYAEG
jgi:hypothetical protein